MGTSRPHPGSWAELLVMKPPKQPPAAGSGLPKDLRAQAEESLAHTRRDVARRPELDPLRLVHELEVHQIELEMQNDQLRQSRQGLEETRNRLADLYDFAPCALLTLSEHGEVLEANLAAATLLSLERSKLIHQKFTRFIPAEAQDDFYRYCRQVRHTGVKQALELLLQSATGTRLTVWLEGVAAEDPATRKTQFRLSLSDITKQKQHDRHVEGVRELLELFATKRSRQDYIDCAVRYLRDWSGARCVGIRMLDASGRIPYTASLGYSPAFIRLENCLTLESGNCPCLRVFQGRALASDKQFTSEKGSVICNRASRLAPPFGATSATPTQLACLQAGYASLAHTPIRYCGELLGMVHLADPREDRFPPETVDFLESVAMLIGEAFHRFQIEESLAESEQRFRSMFERHEAPMLLVDPESGTIEDGNPAAAAFYGYSRERLRNLKQGDLNGLRLPATPSMGRRSPPECRSYTEAPHRLASGEIRTVEIYASPVQVKGRQLCFAIIHDITERKLLEKQVIDIGEAERQRIGQDLHDSLGGLLTGVALLGQALANRLAVKAVPEASVAQEIVGCINDAISQTRAIARGLFPADLSAAGLAVVLRELAAETTKRSGIACRFLAGKEVSIPDPAVTAHLFRIVQEAVNNAVRHSGARHITIRLTRSRDQVLLEVQDDGKGLPARQPAGRGLGLRTMKYRAEIVGAQFDIQSGGGRGTVVSCRLLRPRESDKK